MTRRRQPPIPPGMAAEDFAIITLMSRPKIPWQCKLEPEQRECILLADELRHLTGDGRYRGIWTHVPNEGKRHPLVAIILKAMGMITGFADYIFLWPTDTSLAACAIEMKVKGGRLTDNQTHFATWCGRAGIPIARCETHEDALAILRQHGAIP